MKALILKMIKKHSISNKKFAIVFALLASLFITTNLLAQQPDLFQKVGQNDIKGVKELIEADADVNQEDKSKFTPLFLAMMNNNAEMAKLLIEAGADVNYKNYLAAACINKQAKMVKLLVASGADLYKEKENYGYIYTPLIQALSNSLEIAEILIESGADINYQDTKNGYTALIFASMNAMEKQVIFLIERGADVNAESLAGDTALSLANQRKFHGIVKILKANGAK